MSRPTGVMSSPSTIKICVFKLHKVRHFRCYYIEIDIDECFPKYNTTVEQDWAAHCHLDAAEPPGLTFSLRIFYNNKIII